MLLCHSQIDEKGGVGEEIAWAGLQVARAISPTSNITIPQIEDDNGV